MSGVRVLHGAFKPSLAILSMELNLQPGDMVKVLESAALGWVRARVIRVKSSGRIVVQSDQGREFTARRNQIRLIEPSGFRP
uniref:SH3 domain-containing protein n=1 Tax=Paulinella chromatophora TaxID=39717 RepID=B1X3G4_PAUCH|nr:hypothetical protein PCC_0022 [Paulinella chromatophora]ACB42483.1 hypothetical protein PCC_0022 [Paulinella chromatophora]